MNSALSGIYLVVRGCRGVLVDSNVLLDLAIKDPIWREWSAYAVQEAAKFAPLIINPLIYAEVSVDYSTAEALDEFLPRSIYRRDRLPWEAAFVAGKCYSIYRRRGGVRTAPLSDFYIGAHAAVAGFALLTRDANVYRGYFPRLPLITP